MNRLFKKIVIRHPGGRRVALGLSLAALMLAVSPVQATTISTTLGNANSGFAVGSVPGFPATIAAQSGQPAPFNSACGAEISAGSNCTAAWTFSYSIPITDTITSAMISLGIVDTDSGSITTPFKMFSINNVDFTSTMNALSQSTGFKTTSGAYELYTFNLSNTVLASLANGSATVNLALQGPVINPGLPGISGPQTVNFNGASLIFSTLSIVTLPRTIINNVPEPSVLLLMMAGLFCAAGFKTRRITRLCFKSSFGV
jgi:hypothetical protein